MRLHEDELLSGEERCGEESRHSRRDWSVLHQEEDNAVRRLRCRSIVLGMVLLRIGLKEMMHQVRARHGKQGEEQQHCTAGAETIRSLTPGLPPSFTTCTALKIHRYAAHRQCQPSLCVSPLLRAHSRPLLTGQQGLRGKNSSPSQARPRWHRVRIGAGGQLRIGAPGGMMGPESPPSEPT